MSRRTPEERLQIVQLYYANNNSVRATFRALRPFYGVHNRPTELQIRRTVDRFCSTFTLCDNVHPERRRIGVCRIFFGSLPKPNIRQFGRIFCRSRIECLFLPNSSIWQENLNYS